MNKRVAAFPLYSPKQVRQLGDVGGNAARVGVIPGPEVSEVLLTLPILRSRARVDWLRLE